MATKIKSSGPRVRRTGALTPVCRTPRGSRAPVCVPVGAACESCGDPDTFTYEGELFCPTCVEYAPVVEDGEGYPC